MTITLVSITVVAIYLAAFFVAESYWQGTWGFSESVGAFEATMRVALCSCTTYLGILAQILTRKLKQSQVEQVRIIDEIRSALSTRDFWLAVLASPIVLLAVYQAIADLSSLLVIALLGFQNGFFFHAILSREEARAQA